MDVSFKNSGDELTVVLSGRLDTLTSPELEKELSGKLGGIKKLIFDFSKLEYISSAGLRVLLTAQKSMNIQGSMVIKYVNEEINEIFDVTGFSNILSIE